MSDPTSSSDSPEDDEEGVVRPRHTSAAERRSSETVMLDSGNLGDMVSEAKGDSPEPTPSTTDADADEEERKNVILIVGVAVIIVLAGIIGYLIYIAD